MSAKQLIESVAEGDMFLMQVPLADKEKAAKVLKSFRAKPLPDRNGKAEFGFKGSDPEGVMSKARRALKDVGIIVDY